MKKLLFFCFIFVARPGLSQNVGIGISLPTNPLSFPATIEKKISFYPSSSGDYGIGISNGLLKIYSGSSVDDIALGYDDYGNGFTERMRIRGNGNVGIGITDPQAPLDVAFSNAALYTAMFRGTDYASLFNFGTRQDIFIRAGKQGSNVILNDIVNGRVGIGYNNPSATLGFAPATGKKISLYPGATGDVGFSVEPSLLEIYGDHPNADIAFGYDQGGTFTERMRIKGNGNVGIGTNNPLVALSFPGTFGKKISLFPGATGDAGFGMAGNRMQIFSDNPNADVAIGFDVGGTFNERFAFKPSGALAINGNAGSAGQVLVNNASGVAQWSSGLPQAYHSFIPNAFTWAAGDDYDLALPWMNITFTLTRPSSVISNVEVHHGINNCFGCGDQGRSIALKRNGAYIHEQGLGLNAYYYLNIPGYYEHLGPGTYTYEVVFHRIFTNYSINFYGNDNPAYKSYMTIMVIPD